MRRPLLLTLAALGGIIVLLGGAVFAALTDAARSGTNTIQTEPLPPSADLQVAPATVISGGAGISCGSFSEELVSALITIGAQGVAFVDQQEMFYCVRNVGSRTVQLFVGVTEFDDVEVACTGDEELFDESCGTGAGEIAEAATVTHAYYDETAPTPLQAVAEELLATERDTPALLVELSPGETAQFSVSVSVNPLRGELAAQRAQSDRLTWRFLWTAQA